MMADLVKLMDVTESDPFFKMPGDDRLWRVQWPPLPSSDDPNWAPYGIPYQPKPEGNSCWVMEQSQGLLFRVQSSTLVERVRGVMVFYRTKGVLAVCPGG